jgi:hypothetical protein
VLQVKALGLRLGTLIAVGCIEMAILGPTNRYSNKKRGMWPSCVERYTPKPVLQ